MLGRADGHRVDVEVVSRDLPVSVEITVRESAVEKMRNAFQQNGNAHPFHDPPEYRKPDLLRLRLPDKSEYSMDVLRLLCNPIAGNNETLEKTSSWPALLTIGASLHEAGKLSAFQNLPSLKIVFEADDLDHDFIRSITVREETLT